MSPKKVRRHLLIAACFIGLLALCGFGYAVSIYWGAGSAENISFDNLTQPFGTIIIDNDELSTVMGHEFSETLQAAEDGDYYLCVTNKSSENAVIVSGTISKATTDN